MRWYERLPERWKIEQQLAQQHLLDVEVGINDDDQQAFIRGTLVLETNSGHELDRFRIRIVYPEAYPVRSAHPAVHLDSHHDKWVCTPDNHMPDWCMCLYVPLESGQDFSRPDEFLRLLEHVYAYLHRQRLYQIDYKRYKVLKWRAPKWPGPERAHGLDGILDALIDAGGVERNEACICGSGKKYKRCCKANLEPLLEQRKRERDDGTIPR